MRAASYTVTWSAGQLPTDGKNSSSAPYGAPTFTTGTNSPTNFAGQNGECSGAGDTRGDGGACAARNDAASAGIGRWQRRIWGGERDRRVEMQTTAVNGGVFYRESRTWRRMWD